MTHFLSKACSRTLLLLSLSLPCAATPADSTSRVTAPNLSVNVSSNGEIVALTYGPGRKERSVHALLQLAGCRIAGPVSVESTPSKGVTVTKRWIFGRDSSECVVTERFEPSGSSIRWEAEIRGTGNPWSTAIETRLTFPRAKTSKIWAPWGDPRRGRIARMTPAQQARLGILPGDSAWTWSDPLVPIPFVNDTLWFGAEVYRHEDPKIGFIPFQGNLICIPMVTVMEPDHDQALTIALSPEDVMLDLCVVVTEQGSLHFSRLFHRISDKSPIKFALDIVPHEADWRGALRWVAERYPAFFNPAVPGADDVAGTGAYSAHETEFDVAKMKKMAFGVNWKASFDFPYMGMFLAPVDNDTVQWTRYGGGPTSVKSMRDYSASMRAKGFHVLSYFNVTEFGANIIDPPPPKKGTRDEDLWRDPNDFLYTKLAGAIIPIPPKGAEVLHNQNPRLRPDGPYYTWGDGIVTDPADPAYQEFLLDQAKRHIDEIPDASGICIDRMDWLRLYNYKGDDGISWFDGAPGRSQLRSWRSIMSRLGPLMHNAGKVIFVNNHDKRIDMLDQTDGFFDEFTYAGSPLNLTAFQGIRKPTLGWTGEEKHLRPDPDVFFQKYLHMGVYPTAPFPGNDHSLLPSAWVDSQYLDYGPLLQPLRGKKWVLTPHCVEVVGAHAKVNLFEVADGWAVPVTFGPKKGAVTVRLRGVPGLSANLAVDAIHPGSETAKPLKPKVRKGTVELNVPLVRGCAMVRVKNQNNQQGQRLQ